MRRWSLLLCLWTLAVGLAVWAWWTEVTVRTNVGAGAKRLVAETFYGRTIAAYRWEVALLALGSATCVVLGLILGRSENRDERASRLRWRAQLAASSAQRLTEAAQQWEASDQRRAELLRRRADRARTRATTLNDLGGRPEP